MSDILNNPAPNVIPRTSELDFLLSQQEKSNPVNNPSSVPELDYLREQHIKSVYRDLYGIAPTHELPVLNENLVQQIVKQPDVDAEGNRTGRIQGIDGLAKFYVTAFLSDKLSLPARDVYRNFDAIVNKYFNNEPPKTKLGIWQQMAREFNFQNIGLKINEAMFNYGLALQSKNENSAQQWLDYANELRKKLPEMPLDSHFSKPFLERAGISAARILPSMLHNIEEGALGALAGTVLGAVAVGVTGGSAAAILPAAASIGFGTGSAFASGKVIAGGMYETLRNDADIPDNLAWGVSLFAGLVGGAIESINPFEGLPVSGEATKIISREFSKGIQKGLLSGTVQKVIKRSLQQRIASGVANVGKNAAKETVEEIVQELVNIGIQNVAILGYHGDKSPEELAEMGVLNVEQIKDTLIEVGITTLEGTLAIGGISGGAGAAVRGLSVRSQQALDRLTDSRTDQQKIQGSSPIAATQSTSNQSQRATNNVPESKGASTVYLNPELQGRQGNVAIGSVDPDIIPDTKDIAYEITPTHIANTVRGNSRVYLETAPNQRDSKNTIEQFANDNGISIEHARDIESAYNALSERQELTVSEVNSLEAIGISESSPPLDTVAINIEGIAEVDSIAEFDEAGLKTAMLPDGRILVDMTKSFPYKRIQRPLPFPLKEGRIEAKRKGGFYGVGNIGIDFTESDTEIVIDEVDSKKITPRQAKALIRQLARETGKQMVVPPDFQESIVNADTEIQQHNKDVQDLLADISQSQDLITELEEGGGNKEKIAQEAEKIIRAAGTINALRERIQKRTDDILGLSELTEVDKALVDRSEKFILTQDSVQEFIHDAIPEAKNTDVMAALLVGIGKLHNPNDPIKWVNDYIGLARVKHSDLGIHHDFRGLTKELSDNTKTVVALTKNATPDTWIHELGHVLRQHLPVNIANEIDNEFGVKDGVWTRDQEEEFAKAFVKYVSGNEDHPSLAPLRSSLRTVYAGVSKAKSAPVLNKLFGIIITGSEGRVDTKLPGINTINATTRETFVKNSPYKEKLYLPHQPYSGDGTYILHSTKLTDSDIDYYPGTFYVKAGTVETDNGFSKITSNAADIKLEIPDIDSILFQDIIDYNHYSGISLDKLRDERDFLIAMNPEDHKTVEIATIERIIKEREESIERDEAFEIAVREATQASIDLLIQARVDNDEDAVKYAESFPSYPKIQKAFALEYLKDPKGLDGLRSAIATMREAQQMDIPKGFPFSYKFYNFIQNQNPSEQDYQTIFKEVSRKPNLFREFTNIILHNAGDENAFYRIIIDRVYKNQEEHFYTPSEKELVIKHSVQETLKEQGIPNVIRKAKEIAHMLIGRPSLQDVNDQLIELQSIHEKLSNKYKQNETTIKELQNRVGAEVIAYNELQKKIAAMEKEENKKVIDIRLLQAKLKNKDKTIAGLREKIKTMQAKHKENVREIRQSFRDRQAKQQEKKWIENTIKRIVKMPDSKDVLFGIQEQMREFISQYDTQIYRQRDLKDKRHAILRGEGKPILQMLSVAELRQIVAKLEDLREHGVEELEAQKNKERREAVHTAGVIADHIINNIDTIKKMASFKSRAFLGTLSPGTFFRMMDVNQASHGPISKFLYDQVWNALNDREKVNHNDHVYVFNALKELDIKPSDMHKPIDIPYSIDKNSGRITSATARSGKKFDVSAAMHVYALNQNEKGQEALVQGNNIDYAIIDEVISALPERYKKLTDRLMDIYERKFPEIDAVYIALNNEAMVKEERYSPILRMTTDTDIEADNPFGNKGYDGSTIRQSVRQNRPGFSKARTGGTSAVKLDMFTTHLHMIPAINHYVKVQPVLKKIVDALEAKVDGSKLNDVIIETYGRATYDSLKSHLNKIANPRSWSGDRAFQPVVRKIRQRGALIALSFNTVTIIKQLPSILLTLGEVGLPRLLLNFAKALNPKVNAAMYDTMVQSQPLLRARRPSKELYQLENRMKTGLSKVEEKIAKIGMAGIMAMDNLAVTAAWNAIYEKNYQALIKKNVSEKEAAKQAGELAGKIIIATQPVGNPEFQSELIASKGPLALITQFTNQPNQIWNLIVSLPTAVRSKILHKQVGALTGYLIGAVIFTLLQWKRFPENEEELPEFGAGVALNMVNVIPVIGPLLFAAAHGYSSDTLAESSISNMVLQVPKIVSSIAEGSPVGYNDISPILQGISLGSIGIPVVQLNRIVRAFTDDDEYKSELQIIKDAVIGRERK